MSLKDIIDRNVINTYVEQQVPVENVIGLSEF